MKKSRSLTYMFVCNLNIYDIENFNGFDMLRHYNYRALYILIDGILLKIQ